MYKSFDADIDVFAELLAHLDDPFADRAAVLAAANLDEKSYQKLRDRWTSALSTPSERTAELAQHFGDAYARAQQAIRDARHDIVHGGAAPAPDPRFLNADVQPWREQAAGVPLLAPSAASVIAQPSASHLRSPIYLGDLRTFSTPANSSIPSPWVPAGMKQFDDVHSTQTASDAPASPVLPFGPSDCSVPASRSTSPADPASSMPRAMLHFTDVHGTDLSVATPTSTDLPFKPRSSLQEAVEPSSPSRTSVEPPIPSPDPASRTSMSWLPPGMQGFADVGGTQLATAADTPKPAMPFDSSPSKRIDELPRAQPWVPKGMQDFTDIEGTQIGPDAPAVSALPFKALELAGPQSCPPQRPEGNRRESHPDWHTNDIPAPPPPLPSLSLEQYASLRVELDMAPARRHEVLLRYHVTEEQQQRLDGHWRARLEGDSGLRSAWERAYSSYRAWLLNYRP